MSKPRIYKTFLSYSEKLQIFTTPTKNIMISGENDVECQTHWLGIERMNRNITKANDVTEITEILKVKWKFGGHNLRHNNDDLRKHAGPRENFERWQRRWEKEGKVYIIADLIDRFCGYENT